MSFIVKPSRNKIVQAAFDGLRADERRMKRIASICKTKPEPTPAPAAKKAPARKRAGKK